MEVDIQDAQQYLVKKRGLLRLTERGPTSLTEEEVPECEICGGLTKRGVCDDFYCEPCTDKLIEADKEAVREESQKWREGEPARALNNKIGESAVGDRFKGMTFTDYKPTCDKAKKVLSDCENYVQNFQTANGAGILMLGSPGTGKNMLAAIIGQEIIKRGHTFFHTTALKLVRKIKSTWKNSGEDEQTVIDSFTSPSLLVIDEIGVQFGSQTEQLFLTEVINERYEKRRPTILISNLKLSQLTEVMGERVIDRFYDDGSKMLIFDWPSYRRNKP